MGIAIEDDCDGRKMWQVGGRHTEQRIREQIISRLKMRIQLTKLAHARSGDKGDTANIGLIALRDEFYPLLVREVTAERVKEHFKGICQGRVERYELPNLSALNFLLHESLDGGGTLSLMTDAQGKTFSTALLRQKGLVGQRVCPVFALYRPHHARPGVAESDKSATI